MVFLFSYKEVGPMPSAAQKKLYQDWIDGLLKDLKQVLNSPWLAIELEKASLTSGLVVDPSYKTGLNFAANAAVMIALESIGRLATGRREGLGSAAAFVKSYFHSDYHDCIELVWQLFRNGHAHNYLPNWVTIADALIFGQVVWIDPSPEIRNFESRMQTDRSRILSNLNPGHLDLRQTNPNGYAFSFYPQVAYVDLALAVEKWRQKLASDRETEVQFSQSIIVAEDARSAIYGLESPIGSLFRGKGII